MEPLQAKKYTFSNETGDASLTVYTVFPGVEVAYHSVHMDHFDIGQKSQGSIIEIHHCCEGRIEQEFTNGLFYLMPGDMSVAIRNQTVDSYCFPLRHYHGVTIVIDVEHAPEDFAEYLNGVSVKPMEIARRLCQTRSSFVARSEAYVNRIFSEMYSIPEKIRPGFLKIKVLELLLILGEIMPVDARNASTPLSRKQVDLAKMTAAFLSENMDRHVTIAELAGTFDVSETTIKTAFKGVYGFPVYSFIRTQKMLNAAQQLIHTGRPIQDIASECGYDNGSKFSAAFSKVLGESPTQYRKMHGKQNFS